MNLDSTPRLKASPKKLAAIVAPYLELRCSVCNVRHRIMRTDKPSTSFATFLFRHRSCQDEPLTPLMDDA